MDKKKYYCILLIFLLIFSIVIPVWLLLLFPDNSATIDLDWNSNVYVSSAEPEGFELTVWIDGVEQPSLVQYADSLGEAKFYIMSSGDYVVKYVDANGNTQSIDIGETSSATYVEVLTCYENIFTLQWSHDLSILNTELLDLQWYNGSEFITVKSLTTSALGVLNVPFLSLGEFRFLLDDSVSNDTFTISAGDVNNDIPDMIYIEAIGIIISIILEFIIFMGITIYKKLKSKRCNDSVITGEFEILALNPFLFFFSLKRIISIRVSKVKSFPLFLSTIFYNETKTSYHPFHYSLDFCLLVILPLKLFTNNSVIKYE